MERKEKMELLDQAQEKLYEVIDLLEQSVGDDINAQEELITPLRKHCNNMHGFLEDELSIDDLREKIMSEEEEV